jgi:hypothetical protein
VTSAAWAVDGATGAAILYSGLLSSFFAYGAMAFVNARMGPITVMAFYPLQSVLTPILCSIFLGSAVQPADIGGGAAIVAGLALCVWAKAAEGGAPANSLVAMDEDRAEAVTVTLSPRDLEVLDEALCGAAAEGREGGGEEEGGARAPAAAPAAAAAAAHRLRRANTLASVVGPILSRSLSRSSLAGGASPRVAGEASGLLRWEGGGAAAAPPPPGGLARSASVLSGVRRRAATRGADVVVGFI